MKLVANLKRRALLAVAIAVVAWSASTLLVRGGGADPVVFNAWRLWMAVPLLAAVVVWRGHRRDPSERRTDRATRKRTLLVFVGGGALFAAGATAVFAAIDETRLLDVTLITSLQPVLVVAFAVSVLGERISGKQAFAAIIAVLGTGIVAVASADGGSWSLRGDLLAVLGLLLYAGWFLYGRVLRTRFPIDPFSVMLGVLATAALLLTPVAFVSNNDPTMTGRAYLFAAATMLAGTTAHVLMIWAHRYLPASVSAPLLLAQPPIVALGAWVWFGEALGGVEIIGSLTVVVALTLVARTPALEQVENQTTDPVPPT